MKKQKFILYKEADNNNLTKGYRITLTAQNGYTTVTEYIDFINYGLRKVCQYKTSINIDYLIYIRLTDGYHYI